MYRSSYNIFASNGILFNHESPLRGQQFVTKKIISNLVRIKFNIQKTPFMTLISFLNCEKYPPSLQFLLMTGAVGLFLLYLLENSSGNGITVFKHLGGVPMFYYLIHLPLIIGLFHLRQGLGNDNFQGYELTGVYIVWIGMVILMYPFCRGYRYLKTHKSWRWLKYI